MKFKFCGDLDCPDWLLLEIVNLSKLSNIKVLTLSSNLIKCILEKDTIDLAILQKLLPNDDTNDNKALMAALHFMIIQAAKYDTAPSTLSEEIQQLGLPKEHSVQIVKCYTDNYEKIVQFLKTKTIMNSRIINPIKWSIKTPIENRFARIALSDSQVFPLDPLITIEIRYKKTDANNETCLPLTMTYVDFLVLKSEISKLMNKMNSLAKF